MQQALRSAANDPQMQLAQDSAAQLAQTQEPQGLSQVHGTISIGHTLAPFVVVYDASGKPVAGNGYLDGQLFHVPVGVLQAANNQAEHAVTLQPTDNLRLAAITVKAGNYYVLAARSLREVEKREAQSLQLTALGWLGSMVVLAAAALYLRKAV